MSNSDMRVPRELVKTVTTGESDGEANFKFMRYLLRVCFRAVLTTYVTDPSSQYSSGRPRSFRTNVLGTTLSLHADITCDSSGYSLSPPLRRYASLVTV